MKIKFFLFCLLSLNLAYAGTPSVNGVGIIYAIALVLLGIFIFTPFLIKIIKNKMKAKQEETEEESEDKDANAE